MTSASPILTLPGCFSSLVAPFPSFLLFSPPPHPNLPAAFSLFPIALPCLSACSSAFPAPFSFFPLLFYSLQWLLPPASPSRFPILPAAFSSSQVLFHAPACFSPFPATFFLLFHLHPPQLPFCPPSPAVCFSAFPAALPFASTTTSCFSIFLPDFSLSHTHIHTSTAFPSFQLLPHSLISSPPPPAAFPSHWLLFHLFRLLLHHDHFPWLLCHSPTAFPPFQLLFHLSSCSSTPSCFSILVGTLPCPLLLFSSFFPSVPWSNLLLHHLAASPPHPFHHHHWVVPSPVESFSFPTSHMNPLSQSCIPVLLQLHPLYLPCISVFTLSLTPFSHHILHLVLGTKLASAA